MTNEQKQKIKDYQKKYRENKKILKQQKIIISIIYRILKIFCHVGNYKRL